MGKPWTPAEIRRYESARHAVNTRMRATPRSRRITLADVVDALRGAGYARSERYVRAVLGGEKRSRPALREISAAVRACRTRREAGLPEWL